jgi:phospholipid/cholesterol/gamma-HCH transport system substrate-binding protein
MTIARGVAVAALALAIVLVAVLLLRPGATHQYDLLFQNAGQLVKDDDVQVGGRRIGSIRKITLTNDNRARVHVEITEPYAPLREGSQAVIRLSSLSGIANRYVALTPAPSSAKKLDDGATLAAGSTTDVVDLDELFNTLDPAARKDLQGVIQGFAAQYQGKGPEAAKSAEYFNPFLSTSRRLVSQLTQDEGTLTDFIVNSSRAVTAVAERRDDLAGLVSNTNATAGAIGQENVALATALGLLPTTLRRANTTFVNLRATLDDLDVLVAASKPATKRLAPFLRELRPLVHASRPTIRDLRKLVTQPGADNDLLDATRKLPHLQRVASPVFAHSTQALQKSQPVLEFIRPYIPELTGWFHDFGQSTSNYDANGHFARIQPIFNAFSFTDNPAGGVLRPQGLNDKFAGLQTNIARRCPGAASQRAEDGSAPSTDHGNLGPDDCDPSLALPGP